MHPHAERRTRPWVTTWLVIGAVLLAVIVLTLDAMGGLSLFPPQTTELQDPRTLQYYGNSPTVVTQPLPELLKTIRELKGLEPAPSQDDLPQILEKVGNNVKAFFENFPNTTSREKISTTLFRPDSSVAESESDYFNYLALAQEQKDVVGLKEYRTTAKGEPVDADAMGGRSLVTEGFASMSVHFHPFYRRDSVFRYLGRQILKKQPTYVVAFAQRPMVARVVGRVSVPNASVFVLIQGVAWIDAENYQILRLRTDLLAPRLDIGLKRQTTEIWYEEVRFKDAPVALWLPWRVVVTIDFADRTCRNEHRYSKFQLFSVGTEQKAQSPEAPVPVAKNPN